MAAFCFCEKRRVIGMISINRNKANMHRQYRIYIILAVLLGIFMYYLYSYILLYQKEWREKKEIQRMEYNLFPCILTDIHIPYWSTGFLIDTLPESIKKPESSDSSKNSPKNWKGDCILTIPDIELEKIVYTGVERLKHLEEYGLATADDNMKYKNGGNYIICGHASRLYGHSLNRIKEIKRGTIIYIKTPGHTDQYVVDKVTFENMNETSKYCSQTTEQRITIISCAKYVSKESYIVIQAVPD